MLVFDKEFILSIGAKHMDNEDFGKNNPPFQRYIPPCYGRHQKYIPSLYLIDNNGTPEEDTAIFDTMPVRDDIKYRFLYAVGQL